MPNIKTILCSVDLSEHSRAVADYAASLAGKLGARVVCLYVAPSMEHYAGFRVPSSTIDSFVGEIVTGAEDAMNQFVAENFGENVEGRVVAGYPAEEILKAIAAEGADLLVMGTHGRKGIDRILFGSVAEKVVKSASCPVLTVRPGN